MKEPAFWSDRNAGIGRLLSPLGALYGLGGLLKEKMTTSHKAEIPVICIGNLVAGGVGKTPVALALADYIAEKYGKRVFFLSRGYGGRLSGVQVDPERHTAEDVGDEPLLLATKAPVIVCADRAKGARMAAEKGAEVLLMDDGFQNPSLQKDFSLIVIDGQKGFGNGRLIPAGPLREPVARGIKRADALLIMGEDHCNCADIAPHLPLIKAHIEPDEAAGKFKDRTVVAFAGIGRPEKFFRLLEAIGATVLSTHPFADHYPYAPADIQPILDEAFNLKAAPVTTEKDAVRLPPDQRQQVDTLGIRAVFDKTSPLSQLFDPLLG